MTEVPLKIDVGRTDSVPTEVAANREYSQISSVEVGYIQREHCLRAVGSETLGSELMDKVDVNVV